MFTNLARNTLDPQLSCKTIRCGEKVPDLNNKLKNYFKQTFELYQQLFTVIKSQQSFYQKPQPLRHPLVFYYGHTAVFYMNKMLDKGIVKERINQNFQRMFAVGVDQMDWDDLDSNHYVWPKLSEVFQYRQQVKELALKVIQENKQQQITWESNMWAILMCIDHQRLHLQTSAVIIRRLPSQALASQEWLKQCLFKREKISDIPLNKMQKVPSVQIYYNKKMSEASYYGWDIEFGTKQIKVKQFLASKMLVSNGQFLDFVLDEGYSKNKYWNQEGLNWLNKTKTTKPVFWTIREELDEKGNKSKVYYLKTLGGQMKMPWDWPVEVNNLQARAFCSWKSKKINRNIRLPTQDEYFALRNLLKTDYEEWPYQSVGNINLQFWCSPCPVDLFQTQGFCDIVGNVMQHTCTPLYPFQNLQIHPLYEDFITPSFDQRHDMMKGGSFISTGNSASLYYRVGFRRHFYQFTGFRYVQSSDPTEVQLNYQSHSDQQVKQELELQYLKKNTYITNIVQYISKKSYELGDVSLTVGCSVGRFPLELSQLFSKSYGIDYTARYFQMACRLLEKGSMTYKDQKIDIETLNLDKERFQNVRLYQMNPTNTDENKINNVTFALIDCFHIRKGTIHQVIKNCLKLLRKSHKCHILFISNDYNNNMNQHQINNLFDQIPKESFNYTIIDHFKLNKNQSQLQTSPKLKNQPEQKYQQKQITQNTIAQCFYIQVNIKSDDK